MLHRHEAKYGSSGKSPGERDDRTPTLEPPAQAGSSYWSAREEKLKASSVLGSRQSTKSLSQDDDDENVRSKVRSRSRSQSDWQSEESVTSSERKSASKRRRRKTETSSCSGSEYSSVVRERRMSRSSSGSEDVYLASLSRQGGDVGSSLPDRELLREESSEDEPLISTVDRRGSIPEATADRGEDKSEDVGAFGLSSQGANVNLPASFAAYESDVRNYGSRIYESGTDCEDEIEPVDNRDRTGLAQSGYVAHAPQQEGEIQVELWQGSSHWNLSVENVVAGNMANPSLEVISVQEPDGEVIVSDPVDDNTGQSSADQEYQVLYDKPDDASDVVKGTKRPRSPDTDGGSPVFMPSKRLRSESSCSEESVKVTASTLNIKTTSPATSPRESCAEDETSSSSMEQISTEPHDGNSPEPVELILQEPTEEQRDALTEIPLYDDKMNDEIQTTTATEAHTSDIMDSGSPDVVDIHRDGDKYKEEEELTAHSPQLSDGSESSVESKMSPSPLGYAVATSEVVVKSPPDQDRTDLGAPTSDADGVTPSFDTSVADESSTPLLTPIATEVTSLELDAMSSIPLTGEPSSSLSHSKVVPMEMTAVAEAIEEEEVVRSPGVVTMVAEEEPTATEHTEAPANVETAESLPSDTAAQADIETGQSLPSDDQMDADDKPASENLATDDKIIQYSTHDNEVTDVPSHPADEETEQNSAPTKQTCSSGIPSSEERLDEEGSEQDSDRRPLSGEDALLLPSASLPSTQQNIIMETIDAMSPSSPDVPVPNQLTFEDKPDSLLGNAGFDSGESAFVEKHSTVDDVEITSSCSKTEPPSELDEHVGKDLLTDDVKMTESNNETEFPTTEDEHLGIDLPMDDVKMTQSDNETEFPTTEDEHLGIDLPMDDVKMTQSDNETEFLTTENEPVGKDLPIDDIEMTDSDLPMREDAWKELLRDDVKITPSVTEAEHPKIEEEHVGKDLPKDDDKMTSSSTEEEPTTIEDEDMGIDLPRVDITMSSNITDSDLPMRENEDVRKELSGDDAKITSTITEAEPPKIEDEHLGKALPGDDVTQSITETSLPTKEDVEKDLPKDDVEMTSRSTESELPPIEDEHVGKELRSDDVKVTESITEPELPIQIAENTAIDFPMDDVKLTESSIDSQLPTRKYEHVGKELARDDVKMSLNITDSDLPMRENEDVGNELSGDDVNMTSSSSKAELPKDENADNDLPIDDVKMTQSSTDEHVRKELARDDAELTSSSTEEKHPSRKSEQEEEDEHRNEGNVNIATNRSKRKAKSVEKPAVDESVKVSQRTTKATGVEVAKSSPQPEASDVESSFHEGASETCAIDKESQNKLESDEKESVLDAKKESVPDVKKESVPDAKKESVPDAKKESVLDAKKESVPDAKNESILDTKKESVPDAKKESVPDVKKDSVEDTKKESVPDAGASTPSVSPRTKGVEVKAAAPMAGRRKSQRSTVEHHKVPESREHDLRKSTESDRPQSVSAPTREMRGRRAGATPPEGSTREPRKPRRAATPPPLRTRRQSGGSVEAGPSVSSTGRKPTKTVAPPAKAVTPPAVKGKVDSLHVTRSTRKKSEQASLPIAKRLRR